MNFKGYKRPCSTAMICCGIAMLLLFFFSWRALLFTAGAALIFIGCRQLSAHR